MRTTIALAAGFAAVLTAAAATATTLHFSYTSPGGDAGSASWTQSSTPAGQYDETGEYTDIEVTNGTEDGFDYAAGTSDSFSYVEYFNANADASDGGFETTGVIGIYDSGVQIYSGSEAEPVFTTGTYTLGSGVLTVTVAGGVPEPAAWSLMLVGVASVGGLMRARRDRRVAVA